MTSVLYDAAGPRQRRRVAIGSVLGGLLLLALLAVAAQRLAAHDAFDGERWSVFSDSDVLQLLGRGLRATLLAAATAAVLSLLLGLVLAVGRLSTRPWVRVPTRAWVEFFRGVPLLLLILFVFLGLPSLGVNVSAFWALVAGLVLYNSAVIGEIVRAGLLSLPRGQSEAAAAIGLTGNQALRLVLLPQAVRRMLPALISQFVTLLKDTSLGFIIAYEEFLRAGRTAVEFLGGSYSIPVYTGIAVVYIAVNMTLSYLARRVESRTQRQFGGTGGTRRAVAVAAPGASAGAVESTAP